MGDLSVVVDDDDVDVLDLPDLREKNGRRTDFVEGDSFVGDDFFVCRLCDVSDFERLRFFFASFFDTLLGTFATSTGGTT